MAVELVVTVEEDIEAEVMIASDFGGVDLPLSLFSETAGEVLGDLWLEGVLRLSSSFGGVGLFLVVSYGLNDGLSSEVLELLEALEDPRFPRVRPSLFFSFFLSIGEINGLLLGLSMPMLLHVCARSARGLFFASNVVGRGERYSGLRY